MDDLLKKGRLSHAAILKKFSELESKKVRELAEEMAEAALLETTSWTTVPGKFASLKEFAESKTSSFTRKSPLVGIENLRGHKAKGEDAVRTIVHNDVDEARVGHVGITKKDQK